MRILHLIDEPYDSGIVHYALQAASALAGRGHGCWVWARADAYPLSRALDLGLPVLPFAHPWLDLGRLRAFLRAERIDLAVAHTGASHSIAVLAATGCAAKVLRTRGDARPLRRRPGARLLWSRTAGLVAANARILEGARAVLGAQAPRAAVIYEGLKDPGPPAPLPGGPPTFGVVARLDPVKGHETFLAAAAATRAALPDARFVLAGREENVSIKSLRARARELNLEDAVEILGHVPDAAALMARCHVGVVPSLGSEAISRVAVEWMAAGRPLVASAVGCLPEYVPDGVCGRVVPAARPEDLARALIALGRDPLLREAQGRAARGRYESAFGLTRFAAETESFYEETLHPIPHR